MNFKITKEDIRKNKEKISELEKKIGETEETIILNTCREITKPYCPMRIADLNQIKGNKEQIAELQLKCKIYDVHVVSENYQYPMIYKLEDVLRDHLKSHIVVARDQLTNKDKIIIFREFDKAIEDQLKKLDAPKEQTEKKEVKEIYQTVHEAFKYLEEDSGGENTVKGRSVERSKPSSSLREADSKLPEPEYHNKYILKHNLSMETKTEPERVPYIDIEGKPIVPPETIEFGGVMYGKIEDFLKGWYELDNELTLEGKVRVTREKIEEYEGKLKK